jgi:hypothetical protein
VLLQPLGRLNIDSGESHPSIFRPLIAVLDTRRFETPDGLGYRWRWRTRVGSAGSSSDPSGGVADPRAVPASGFARATLNAANSLILQGLVIREWSENSR